MSGLKGSNAVIVAVAGMRGLCSGRNEEENKESVFNVGHFHKEKA